MPGNNSYAKPACKEVGMFVDRAHCTPQPITKERCEQQGGWWVSDVDSSEIAVGPILIQIEGAVVPGTSIGGLLESGAGGLCILPPGGGSFAPSGGGGGGVG